MPEFTPPFERLKIGPFFFEVKWVPDTMQKYNRDFGLCDTDNQVLVFDPGFKKQRLAHTFLHELQHAFENVYCIEKVLVNEEARVDLQATALATFFADNPDVLAWLAGVLRCEDEVAA